MQVVPLRPGQSGAILASGDVVGGRVEVRSLLRRDLLGERYVGVTLRDVLPVSIWLAPPPLVPRTNADALAARLLEAAERASQFTHPQVVRSSFAARHELNGTARAAFITSPLPPLTLADTLVHEPLNTARAVSLTRSLLALLSEARLHELNHLYIHPGSIYLGENNLPMLSGFGVAEPILEQARRAGFLRKDPIVQFLAPELTTGEGGAEQADIYSVGRLLQVMICGERPTEDAPEWLRPIIAKATAYSPDSRYETPDAFLTALSPRGVSIAMAGGAASAAPTPAPIEPAPRPDRQRWLVPLLLLLLLFAFIGFSWPFGDTEPARTAAPPESDAAADPVEEDVPAEEDAPDDAPDEADAPEETPEPVKAATPTPPIARPAPQTDRPTAKPEPPAEKPRPPVGTDDILLSR